ncbi:MAG: glycoside hydrolase family 13 protein [Deinococcota bacterium]
MQHASKQPQPTSERSINTPDWVRDAVFYQIFPDRFAKSERVPKIGRLEAWGSPPTVHGYKGGDLLGVVDNLDYLQDLGVTALYFNPIFRSASNHRYHTHDYYQVDPMLGGNKALTELLEACHSRSMKVVLDGVFNHASRGFFQFSDILENGVNSPYRDWFHIRRFPLNPYGGGDIGYDAWWGLAALPKLNTANPEVREFLFGVAEHWLEVGIDGWRLDVPNEIADDAFWREFRRRCRAINPDCYIVGEIWDDASHWLQGDQFDAVMNYPFTRAILGFTAADSLNVEEIKRCGYQYIPELDADDFAQTVDDILTYHPKAITDVQLNLLGSHDTPRVLTIVGNDKNAVRMSLLFQMTFPGAPCLYYGDELGLAGRHDPDCRQSMPWDDEYEWNRGLLAYTKKLIQLRHEEPALRRGSYHTLYAADGVYIYARVLDGRCLIGSINVNHDPVTLELVVDAGVPLGDYQDVFSDHTLTLTQNTLTVNLAARAATLWQPT